MSTQHNDLNDVARRIIREARIRKQAMQAASAAMVELQRALLWNRVFITVIGLAVSAAIILIIYWVTR